MSDDPYARIRNLLKRSSKTPPKTPPKPPPVPPKDNVTKLRRPSTEDVTRTLQNMTLGASPSFPVPEANLSNNAFIGGFAPNLQHKQPQQSLTMQMALQDYSTSNNKKPKPVRKETYNLSPTRPADNRLHSESHLPIAATPPSPPPVTPAKPRHKRANSTPPASPVDSKQTSGTPKKGKNATAGEPIQCSGITKAQKRCTRQVKGAEGDIIRFCHQHQKEILTPTGYYGRKNGEWVVFSDWIPSYLEPATQAALRAEMERARSGSDQPGYIYTFEIRDPSKPDILQLKVGRAVNLVKRIDQWGKQCGSKEQVLRGWFPGTVDPSVSEENGLDGTSLLKGRVQAGAKGPWCHRLERLVHLELGDLARTQVYLQGGWPNPTTTEAISAAGPLPSSNGACPDCGQAHKEIFYFARVQEGKYVGKEWEKIVQPVIEKWGAFVEGFV